MHASLHRALSRVAAAAERRPLLIPRLATVALIEALVGDAWVERPAIRGRTVWGDTSGSIVIVDQPNRLGCLERVPAGALVVRNVDGAPVPDGSTVIHDAGGTDDDAEGFARRTALARRLATIVVQTRGVHAADSVESPRCMLRVPVDPVRLCVALDAATGITADPLGPTLPEYPGGIAFEIGATTTEADVVAYAEVATRCLLGRSA